jgi:cytochrome oxidase Cu insertion factor (SCO1/SenC/PrrC family)
MRQLLAITVALVLVVTFLPWLPFASGVFAQTDKAAGAQAMKLKVGDPAPDFTLRDQSGKDVSLKDFRGKKSVVLAFYVFAFTGG